MRAQTLFELRIEYGVPQHGSAFDKIEIVSINRYARDSSHAIMIGRKYAREQLRATGEINVKTRIINL